MARPAPTSGVGGFQLASRSSVLRDVRDVRSKENVTSVEESGVSMSPFSE